MKELKMLLLTIVCFTMVSCIDATLRDSTSKIPVRQSVINSWIGKPVTRIMSKWERAPDKSLTIAGKEYIVYETPYQKSYSSQYRGGYSYEYIGCTWTFEIKNGIIVGGTATGSRCDDG